MLPFKDFSRAFHPQYMSLRYCGGLITRMHDDDDDGDDDDDANEHTYRQI